MIHPTTHLRGRVAQTTEEFGECPPGCEAVPLPEVESAFLTVSLTGAMMAGVLAAVAVTATVARRGVAYVHLPRMPPRSRRVRYHASCLRTTHRRTIMHGGMSPHSKLTRWPGRWWILQRGGEGVAEGRQDAAGPHGRGGLHRKELRHRGGDAPLERDREIQ